MGRVQGHWCNAIDIDPARNKSRVTCNMDGGVANIEGGTFSSVIFSLKEGSVHIPQVKGDCSCLGIAYVKIDSCLLPFPTYWCPLVCWKLCSEFCVFAKFISLKKIARFSLNCL